MLEEVTIESLSNVSGGRLGRQALQLELLNMQTALNTSIANANSTSANNANLMQMFMSMMSGGAPSPYASPYGMPYGAPYGYAPPTGYAYVPVYGQQQQAAPMMPAE
jgi:hypothetical protein